VSTNKRRPHVWSPITTYFTNKRLADLKSTQKLYASARTAHDACFWTKPEALPGLVKEILERITPQPPERLLPHFQAAIESILALETVIFDFPEINFNAPLTLKEQTELRSFLRAKERFCVRDDQIINALAQTVLALLNPIARRLPAMDGGTSSLTVPLSALVADLPGVITDMIGTLVADKTQDLGICHNLYGAINTNIATVSGIDPTKQSSKQLVFPKDSKLAGDELVAAYLSGTSLADLLEVPTPFIIPRRAYRAHGCMFAPSDHGKTQTLQALIATLLTEPDPPALFVMDSMGAMLGKLRHLALFQDSLKDRLVILDPAGPTPPQLNFFKLSGGSPAQQMELLFYLFKALDQGLTARQRTTVGFLAQLMQKIDGTLDDLRHVCESKRPQHLDAIHALPPIARDFFLNAFYKPDAFMTQTKAQIVARLYTLASTPVFQMFSAKANTFNAFECIQQKKVVLVNTDRLALGEDGSAIFGRFVIAQVLAAAFARAPIPEDKRHLALLIVDEAKAYLDDQAEKFLSDARQFWVGLFLATQFVHQLDEGVRRAVYGNTAIKFIGPIEYSDRVSLAREMNTTPEFIGSMRGYDRSHTEWAAHVRTSNLTPHALRLRVPYGVLERMPTVENAPLDDPPPTPPSPPVTTQQPGATSARATPAPPTNEAATRGPDQSLLKPGKDW
jgi:hypothetical protein